MNCESFCGKVKRQGEETNWFPYTCLFKKTQASQGNLV